MTRNLDGCASPGSIRYLWHHIHSILGFTFLVGSEISFFNILTSSHENLDNAATMIMPRPQMGISFGEKQRYTK